MPEVTIVLDSGLFDNEPGKQEYTSLDVGYFSSPDCDYDIAVYADGEQVAPPPDIKLAAGLIEVHRKTGALNADIGVELSDSLVKNVLRREELYGGLTTGLDLTKCDCVLRFFSGDICCSMVKPRTFKSEDGMTTLVLRPIAHDSVVHFDLADGQHVEMTSGAGKLWSSADHPGATRVVAQIIASNSTAVRFYKDAIVLPAGVQAMLPNPDDPPPEIMP